MGNAIFLHTIRVLLLILISFTTFSLAQTNQNELRWQVVNSFASGEGITNQTGTNQTSVATSSKVYLDICQAASSYNSSSALSYSWYVNNAFLETNQSCYLYTDLQEGNHLLSVVISNATDNQNLATISGTINLEQLIIAAMGDSFASGEGSPDRPINFESYEAYRAAIEDYQQAQHELQENLSKLLALEELSNGVGALSEDLTSKFENFNVEAYQADLVDSFGALVEECSAVSQDLNSYVASCDEALRQSITAGGDFLTLAASVLGEYGQAFSNDVMNYFETEFADSEAFLGSLEQTQEDLVSLAANCLGTSLDSVLDPSAAGDESAESGRNRITVIGSLRCIRQLQPFARSIADSASEFGELSYQELLEFSDELSMVLNNVLGPNLELKAEELYESLAATYELVDSSRRRLANAATMIQEVVGGAEATWEDPVCHRSLRSSTVQFARRIQQENPHKAVSLVNVSCSGASIHKGLLAPHRGKAPQVEQLKTALAGQKADMLLLSVGGNDIGFTQVLRTCALLPNCFELSEGYLQNTAEEAAQDNLDNQCSIILMDKFADATAINHFLNECLNYFDVNRILDVPQASKVVLPKLAALPRDLRSLAFALNEVTDPNNVYVIEYLDPTKDESGVHCGYNFDLNIGRVNLGLEHQFPGLSREEMAWADESVLQQLNTTLATSASQNNWRYVSGIYDTTRLHGYCSQDTWIQRMQDSFYVQGDAAGVMHPNDRGQAVIADAIYQSSRIDLE